MENINCVNKPEPEVSEVKEFRENSKMKMRWPGIEPGSTAWKAAMLTTIPPTLDKHSRNILGYLSYLSFASLPQQHMFSENVPK